MSVSESPGECKCVVYMYVCVLEVLKEELKFISFISVKI